MSGVGSCNQDIPGAFNKNIQATFNLLNCSKEFNCKKVLIASSQAAEKFNLNPSLYAYTKDLVKTWAEPLKKISN